MLGECATQAFRGQECPPTLSENPALFRKQRERRTGHPVLIFLEADFQDRPIDAD